MRNIHDNNLYVRNRGISQGKVSHFVPSSEKSTIKCSKDI